MSRNHCSLQIFTNQEREKMEGYLCQTDFAEGHSGWWTHSSKHTEIPRIRTFHFCHPCQNRTSVCTTAALSILIDFCRAAPMQKQLLATEDTLRSNRFVPTKETELLLNSISSFWKRIQIFPVLFTTDKKFGVVNTPLQPVSNFSS